MHRGGGHQCKQGEEERKRKRGTCLHVSPQSEVMYISSLYSTSLEPRLPEGQVKSRRMRHASTTESEEEEKTVGQRHNEQPDSEEVTYVESFVRLIKAWHGGTNMMNLTYGGF